MGPQTRPPKLHYEGSVTFRIGFQRSDYGSDSIPIGFLEGRDFEYKSEAPNKGLDNTFEKVAYFWVRCHAFTNLLVMDDVRTSLVVG